MPRVGDRGEPCYADRMDSPTNIQGREIAEGDAPGTETFEQEFDRLIREDDDSAAREILASGMPISIARGDTPPGHVVRVYPDGREELVAVDREAAARILGH